MHNQKITYKKSIVLRIFLIAITAFLLFLVSRFIPTFLYDINSKITVIMLGFLAALTTILTISQCCWKLQFQGQEGLYINEILIKKTFYISDISVISIYDPKGMTAYDREQRKIFFVPSYSRYFLDLLLYLEERGVNLRFESPDSLYKRMVNESLSGYETDSPITDNSYYEETLSPKHKTLQTLRAVLPVVLSYGVYFLLIGVFRADSHLTRWFFIASIFLSITVKYALRLFINYYFESEIQKDYSVHSARIINFTNLESKYIYPVYEFKDQNGLHKIKGLYRAKPTWLTANDRLGTTHNVYYNPQCPVNVLDDDFRALQTRSALSPAVVTVLLFLLTVSTFAVGFFSFGNATKRWQSESYKKSSLTQEDVDSDTVQWICSAYAIYTEINNKELGKIGGAENEEKVVIDAIKIQLDEGWGERSCGMGLLPGFTGTGRLLPKMQKEFDRWDELADSFEKHMERC